MNLYIGWWRGRQASQKSDLIRKTTWNSLPEHWASCCAGDAQQARVALLVGPLPASFTAVYLGILCSGSSRQIVLQSSVPPAAIQFTSTLSFLYMTAGKQILPACRCALRIIKFGSIQHLICQAESPPLFFLWSGYEPINIHVYTLEQLHRDRFTRQNCFSVSLFVNNCNPSL